MSEQLPSESSVHADEGTLAHEIAENELRYRLGHIDEKQRNRNLLELKRNKLYDVEMIYPIEEYVDLVMSQVSEARSYSKDAIIRVEQKMSIEDYVEEGFGTIDFVAVTDRVVFITDLKFGKGVRVSAIENAQLKLYALGVLSTYGMLFDIERVVLTIVQPRLDAVSTWEVDVEDLINWGEQIVKPTADTAFKGEGEHQTGSWCRFCKARTLCPEMKLEALFLAEEDFKVPTNLLEEDEILEVYELSDRIISYLQAVQQHVLESALRGKQWKGLKVVQGNGRGSIQDEKTAMSILSKEGVDERLFTKTTVKLEPMGVLKKHLGKARFEKLIGHLVKKSEGKPTLVPEWDKREAINRAADFE